MNILDVIMQAQGGAAAKQLGQNFGLDSTQTQSALGALLPSLAGAVKQNAQSPGGMEALLGALASGGHQRYLDEPASLGSSQTVNDGNAILGHLLGSKDVSRKVAAHASAQSGMGEDILKKMLPVVAGMMMAGLSKQASSRGVGQGAGGGLLGAAASMLGRSGLGGSGLGGSGVASDGAGDPTGLLGMLTPMLDQNHDGSAIDDVLRMASGFLRK